MGVVFALLLVRELVGLGIGVRRHFTHRAFETGRGLRTLLAVRACRDFQGPIDRWVADHRRDHRFDDGPFDPHSPHWIGDAPAPSRVAGLGHARLGWMVEVQGTDAERHAADIRRDAISGWCSRHDRLLSASSIGLPALLGRALGGPGEALRCARSAGFVRVAVLQPLTGSINPVGHRFGRRVCVGRAVGPRVGTGSACATEPDRAIGNGTSARRAACWGHRRFAAPDVQTEVDRVDPVGGVRSICVRSGGRSPRPNADEHEKESSMGSDFRNGLRRGASLLARLSLATLLLAAPASADLDAFLTLEIGGNPVPGDVTEAGREGTIRVHALSLDGFSPVRSGGTTSAPLSRPVTLLVEADRSAPSLLAAWASGSTVTEAVIRLYEAGSSGVEENVLTLALSNGRVSSYSLNSPDNLDPDLVARPATILVGFTYQTAELRHEPTGQTQGINWR